MDIDVAAGNCVNVWNTFTFDATSWGNQDDIKIMAWVQEPLSAHPAEVYVNEPGRGVQIVLYGMEPEMRLPFETNWGYMLVRNGVPVGYGVAANWFDRAEIAIDPADQVPELAYGHCCDYILRHARRCATE